MIFVGFDSRTLLQKEKPPKGRFFLLENCRRESNPSQMQQSGGLLLTPVQTLAATLIFAIGENANRLLYPAPRKKSLLSTDKGDFFQ